MNRSLSLLAAKRILIVEDENFVTDDVRRALEQAGVSVIGPAPTVEAGMGLINACRIDAAILDIRLDGQAVFPLAERLLDLGIPFVFATAYSTRQIPQGYGGYHLREKPTELGAIAAALFGGGGSNH